jgi:hypothetical protein
LGKERKVKKTILMSFFVLFFELTLSASTVITRSKCVSLSALASPNSKIKGLFLRLKAYDQSQKHYATLYTCRGLKNS